MDHAAALLCAAAWAAAGAAAATRRARLALGLLAVTTPYGAVHTPHGARGLGYQPACGTAPYPRAVHQPSAAGSAADLVPEDGPPPTDSALAVIAARYNARVADLVGAVTAPPRPAGADRIRHYIDHLRPSLDANPWARVIKLSDFTDNGVGIIHTSAGRLVNRSARKYSAAVPVLRGFLDRTDTPLDADVKDHIHRQLDLATQRFTAILAA